MITNEEIKEFAIKLAHAESEIEIIEILKSHKFYQDDSCWMTFGENENNFSVIGAQQSSADAALVEKLINSLDAVLIRRALEEGIDPTSDNAPISIRDALENFFEISEGNLVKLAKATRNTLAKNIQLYVTGRKTVPNYCIVDKGEGQSPNRLPQTILSLSKSNKLRIPFVQGKFNMGGTGVLQFCGKQNFQVIISKRCSTIDDQFNTFDGKVDDSKDYWGVTIVRRSAPKKGAKSSSYEYLAPNKQVLRFAAEELSLVNDSVIDWGTFIKLYEYKIPGCTSVATFDLYYRLSVLMPSVALPIRIIETRDYKGNTLETTINGLNVRLEEDRNKNLEENFPYHSELTVQNQKIKYSLYAFKENSSENYRKNEGVILVVNGQTHGYLPKSIFARKNVQLGYIANSLLAVLDCSNLDLRSREDLFMNSRDKLRNVELKKVLEDCLEDMFRNNTLLKRLQNERRQKALEDKIGDAKPLSEVLNRIIKKSPTLKNFLISGSKITNPFELADQQGDSRRTSSAEKNRTEDFQGKFFPTFFRLRGKSSGYLMKVVPKNRKARVVFETDAANGYFGRDDRPGQSSLTVNGVDVPTYSMNLVSGRVTLNITLPEKCKVGEELSYVITVSDQSNTKGFTAKFKIIVAMAATKPKGNSNKTSLAPPNLTEIKKDQWATYDMNENGVLRVRMAGEGVYDFFVNIDNIHLLAEISELKSSEKIELVKSQYKFGMSLVGLSIIQYYNTQEENKEGAAEEIDISDKVYEITKILSPVFIPMIASMEEMGEVKA